MDRTLKKRNTGSRHSKESDSPSKVLNRGAGEEREVVK